MKKKKNKKNPTFIFLKNDKKLSSLLNVFIKGIMYTFAFISRLTMMAQNNLDFSEMPDLSLRLYENDT